MFDNAKLHIYMNMISNTELILTDDKKIYHLKKRPFKNPLIIHYYNIEQLKKDVELNNNFFKL